MYRSFLRPQMSWHPLWVLATPSHDHPHSWAQVPDDPCRCPVLTPGCIPARRRKHAKRHSELHALRLLRLDRKLSFAHDRDFAEFPAVSWRRHARSRPWLDHRQRIGC